MIKAKWFMVATMAAAVGCVAPLALAAPSERPIVLAQEGKAAGGPGGRGVSRGGGGSGGGGASVGAGPRGGQAVGRSMSTGRASGDGGRRALSESRRGEGGVERTSPRVRDWARGERRVERGVERRVDRGVDWRRRGDGDRSRPWRRGKRFHWGPGIDFWFYDGYYYGDCSWLHRKAIETGSRYWWRRYRLCRASW